MAKPKSSPHVRSAVTGRYVKPINAVRHPRTTVTETVKKPKKR